MEFTNHILWDMFYKKGKYDIFKAFGALNHIFREKKIKMNLNSV